MTSPVAPGRTPFAGHALLMSNDLTLDTQIAQAVQKFAFTVHRCSNIESAARLISTRKFHAIIIAINTPHRATKLLRSIRCSPSNRTAVTFAVANADTRWESEIGPNFVLHRPLNDSLLTSTFKAAMGSIIRDYRRYFRCPLKAPATIQITEGLPVRCELMNISEGGVAVSDCIPLELGLPVTACFELPGLTAQFCIDAEVCWSDIRSRAGLRFCFVPPQQKTRLEVWLSDRIEETFPEPIVQLFGAQQ